MIVLYDGMNFVLYEVQSNLSNSKMKGPPKKNQIIQEFKLGKLCGKLEWVKGPIKNFKLLKNSNYISSN